MADRRHSWVKSYEEVDFSVPFLADNDRPSSSDSGQPVLPPSPSPPKATAPSLPSSSSAALPPRPSPSFSRSFHSSPLNPAAPSPSMPSFLRPNSRASSAARITRIASEECRAFSAVNSPNLPSTISRGSMILYRRADPQTPSSLATSDDILLPPQPFHMNRLSVHSISGDSIVSLSSDSKYPVASVSLKGERGLVAYAYDPELDEQDPPDEEDMMHDPNQRYHHNAKAGKGDLGLSYRGLINITTLVAMILAILCLFVGYPVIAFLRDNGRTLLITGNTRINATGQATFSNFDPTSDNLIGSFSDYIDRSTPSTAYSFLGINKITYDLAFSDEFNFTGKTYRPNENLFWVARDRDLYSPAQITTENGQLSIRIDPLTTSSSSSGQFVSGILDSTVPFCLGQGFVEIGIKDTDDTLKRIFWAGGTWLGPTSPVDDYVPGGPSLRMDISLNLSIGVLVNGIPRNTPPEQVLPPPAVEYVRYYERRVNPSYNRGACDVKRSVQQNIMLNLLNLPR